MQTKIEHQKAVADKVLDKLELLDMHCIIAGGAPRDWYLGKPATDIDVFLYAPQFTSAVIRVETLNRLGFNITNAYENWQVHEIYKHNEYVAQMYNTEVDGEKVQIIFMSKSTYTSVVDTFPISISKAWYKRQKISFTDEFKNSINNKIIWKTLDSYLDSDKYICKILNRFSDYKYVTKEEADKIIKEADKDKLIKDLKFELETIRTVSKETSEKLKQLESENRELRIERRSYKDKFIPYKRKTDLPDEW